MTLTEIQDTITRRFMRQAQRQARQLRRFEQQYIGCEVIELTPGGKFEAVIVAMSYEKTLWNPVYGCDGDWCVRIRYVATGYESETSTHALTLTGRKFEAA